MKRLITFLALCLPIYLFAQGFGSFSHDQPFFALDTTTATPDTPEYLATWGLVNRWVYSDFTNTTWTDRIAGSVWLNNNASTRATFSTNGVYFDSTHFLTNDWQSFPTNVAIGFIINIIDPDDVGDVIHPALLYSWGPYGEGSIYGYKFNYSQQPLVLTYANANYAFTVGPYPVTGAKHTMLFDQQKAANGSGVTHLWTNNVLANSINIGVWGEASEDPLYPVYPLYLGQNRYRNAGPKMYINEMWIWTNIIGFEFPSSVRSNWHYYATNTYGFTP